MSSSPRLSDTELENFIASQKQQLQRERERSESQQRNFNQSNVQPKVAYAWQTQEESANGLTAAQRAPVLRERDQNAARFDKIVRVDANESSLQIGAAASLPLGDRRSARERMKAEMNREYNEYLRSQGSRPRRAEQQTDTAAATVTMAAARPPPAPPRRADTFAQPITYQPDTNPANETAGRTFLTETEQQFTDNMMSNGLELNLSTINSVQAAGPRRDPRLEELAERVRELRSLTTNTHDAPLDLTSRLTGSQLALRPIVQNEPAMVNVMPRLSGAVQPVAAAMTQAATGNFQAFQPDNYYATLPIRDRVSAKERSVDQRNREYNEYIRLKEEADKLRAYARRSGTDVDMAVPVPAQSNQFASVPNYAAANDPRITEVELALERAKQLLGGSSSPIPPNAQAFLGAPARPMPHLLGSGAVPVNPLNMGGDLYLEDRRRRQAEYGRELLAQVELNKEVRRRAKSVEAQDTNGLPARQQAAIPGVAGAGAGASPYGGYALPTSASLTRNLGSVGTPMPAGALGNPYGAVSNQPDLYDFYAMHHPLDLNASTAQRGFAMSGTSNAQNAQTGSPTAGSNYDALQKIRGDSLNTGVVFGSEDERKKLKRVKEQAYQVELQRQIEQSLIRKERDVAEYARYNARKDAEIANYSPFGRAGAGAPIKDRQGNIVSDLRRLRDASVSEPQDSEPPKLAAGFGAGMPFDFNAALPPGLALTLAPFGPMGGSPRAPEQAAASGGDTGNRGGHGIFGTPLTDEQKANGDRYKDDLRKQIEEKRARVEAEKRRQAEEDAREERRLAEQQERVRREMEEEDRRKKAKEEEENQQRRVLEEQRALAANDQNQQKRKRERAPTRQSKQGESIQQVSTYRPNEEAVQPQAQQQQQPRATSPPVPAVRNRQKNVAPLSSRTNDEQSQLRASSPSAPTVRNRNKNANAGVASSRSEMPLQQVDENNARDEALRLAAQREAQREAELQAERDRIAREREEIERERAELARERERERQPRRSGRSNAARSDHDLDNPSRTSSRVEVINDLARLRSMLRNENSRVETELEREARRGDVSDIRPETRTIARHSPPPIDMIDMVSHRYPVMVNRKRIERVTRRANGSATQTHDLDRQFETQRQRLEKLKNRTVFNQDTDPPMRLLDVESSALDGTKLKSDSAFLEVDSHAVHIVGKSDPPLDLFGNEKRRMRGDLGSASSIDPDRIARKNELRMRSLKELAARGDSYMAEDVDDILEQYVQAHQTHQTSRSGVTRGKNRSSEDPSWWP